MLTHSDYLTNTSSGGPNRRGCHHHLPGPMSETSRPFVLQGKRQTQQSQTHRRCPILTNIPSTQAELDKFAEAIKPGAIALAESLNMPIEMAASITSMLQLFIDQNDEAIRQALANGEQPEDVVRDLLAAFQRDVIPFLIKWNSERITR